MKRLALLVVACALALVAGTRLSGRGPLPAVAPDAPQPTASPSAPVTTAMLATPAAERATDVLRAVGAADAGQSRRDVARAVMGCRLHVVAGEDGVPLAEAYATILGDDSTGSLGDTFRAGEDGRISLPPAPSPRATIRVEASGRAPALLALPSAAADEVLVPLARAATIEVLVGASAGPVRVDLWRTDARAEAGVVRSSVGDSSRLVVFADLESGSYDACALYPGLGFAWRPGIVVRPAEAARAVLLPLAERAGLTVFVRAADGASCAGAQLELRARVPGMPRHVLERSSLVDVTDAAGTARFSLAPGEWTITARAQDSTLREHVDLARSGVTTSVELRFRPAGIARVRPVLRGTPPVGGSLELRAFELVDEGPAEPLAGEPLADGDVRFRGLRHGGNFRVEAWLVDGAGERLLARRGFVGKTQAEEEQHVRLVVDHGASLPAEERADWRVAGSVVDERGFLVPGVRVVARALDSSGRADREDARTGGSDAHGRFDLAIPARLAAVEIAAGDRRYAAVDPPLRVVPGEFEPCLLVRAKELPPNDRGEVHGRVVAPAKGLRPRDLRGGTFALDGERFSLRDARSGRFDLVLTAPGFLPFTVPGVDLFAGGVVDVGELALEPAATVVITVRDRERRVPEGLRVKLVTPRAEVEAGRTRRTIVLARGESGEYRSVEVPRERWRVLVEHEGRTVATRTIDARGREQVRARVELGTQLEADER